LNLPRGKYFRPEEMSCKDGTPYPEVWALRLAILFSVLDRIRERRNRPMRVISGYRTPEYNRKRGGAKDSQHVMGRAADVTDGDVDGLHDEVMSMIAANELDEVGGVGRYDGWIHIDTRPRKDNGDLYLWDERTKK
jgi:uncharacterized protein YcbK (DUF882 family)